MSQMLYDLCLYTQTSGNWMNPCREGLKVIRDSPCSELGHCIWEGSNMKPKTDEGDENLTAVPKNIVS